MVLSMIPAGLIKDRVSTLLSVKQRPLLKVHQVNFLRYDDESSPRLSSTKQSIRDSFRYCREEEAGEASPKSG